jgi:hypothetical protein
MKSFFVGPKQLSVIKTFNNRLGVHQKLVGINGTKEQKTLRQKKNKFYLRYGFCKKSLGKDATLTS